MKELKSERETKTNTLKIGLRTKKYDLMRNTKY